MESKTPFGKTKRKSLSAICLPLGTNLALWELGLCDSENFRSVAPGLKEQEEERMGDWD